MVGDTDPLKTSNYKGLNTKSSRTFGIDTKREVSTAPAPNCSNREPKKKTPNAAATAAGVQTILQISLLVGYGIAQSSASPRRYTVSADLWVEVLE